MALGLTEADLDRRREYVELKTSSWDPITQADLYRSDQEKANRIAIRIRLEGDGDWLWRTDERLKIRAEIVKLLEKVKETTKRLGDPDLDVFVGETLDGGRDSTDPYYDYFEGEHAGVLDAVDLYLSEGGPA